MSEVNMMEFLEDRFGEIQSGLFQELLSKEILKNDKWVYFVLFSSLTLFLFILYPMQFL